MQGIPTDTLPGLHLPASGAETLFAERGQVGVITHHNPFAFDVQTLGESTGQIHTDQFGEVGAALQLAVDEREAQEVLSSLPNSFSTPELKVEMHEGENHDFVAEFQRVARFADAKITTIDGLRADFADGWGLVRASNTTPILVIRFDADSEVALQRIKDAFRQQLLAIYDQLKLPF